MKAKIFLGNAAETIGYVLMSAAINNKYTADIIGVWLLSMFCIISIFNRNGRVVAIQPTPPPQQP